MIKRFKQELKQMKLLDYIFIIILLGITITAFIIGSNPLKKDNSNLSFPKICLTKTCSNVSVNIPKTNYICIDTLFMKEGSLYCNIKDIEVQP